MSPLRRLAARAPVPVFALAGKGGRERLKWLRLRPEIDLVDSPRSADILLVAGRLPPSLVGPALAVHDQMSHPRLTAVWGFDDDPPIPDALAVTGDEAVGQLVEAHTDLLSGRRVSEPAALLDIDPNPWRGVGPYGQGGTGMTGGVPYGRPLPGRSPDRDGLQLDQLALRVGPFFPPFPSGLVLDLHVQGDVIQKTSLGPNPYQGGYQGGKEVPPEGDERRPLSVVDVELARARHHLTWLAEALRIHGLSAIGMRALALARDLTPAAGSELRRLRALIRRSRVLEWSGAGIGHLTSADVAGRGLGPVARSSGVAEDRRQHDPTYRSLGFETVVHAEGDGRARWLQRLDEVEQSLGLARDGGDRRVSPGASLESPRGYWADPTDPPSSRLLDLLPEVMAGLEWGDAVATLVSLDLDMEEAAHASLQVAAP